MADNIDEKVVQLTLDNKSFEKDTETTIHSLDELKKSLEFNGIGKGFDEITKSASKVNLNPISQGVQAVSNQFNLLTTVADTFFRNLTNKAVDAGEKLIKSLSIEQISAGWSKYEDKTVAVQTIMSATANQFSDTAEQMSYVENSLERLNWFTDETSYKFLDMVQNIGKFTSNAVDLDVSVDAMQGIATWAAKSGANVNEAGRAMYNLAQAIAVGSVKLIDWKSIENANMSTVEFKQTAIDTAVALGTLTEVGDGLYQTLAGHEVSVKNFNENLSDAWFTSEALLQTLSKYGGFSTRLYEFVEAAEDLTTTNALAMIDEFIDGTLDMNSAMSETGMSAEELKKWLEELGSEEYALGRSALKAAQESKTFADVIGYIKEAVSTGWMNTFELIFGNYTEAKSLWSQAAEGLYDVFVAAGDTRNELLTLWKDAGGRDSFINGIMTLASNIWNTITIFKDAFREIFPATTVDDLLNITWAFEAFAETFKLTDEAAESLTQIFKSFLNVLKAGYLTIKTFVRALTPFAQVLNRLVGMLVLFAGNMAAIFNLDMGNLFDGGAFDSLYDVLSKIVDVITKILNSGLDGFAYVLAAITAGVKGLKDAFDLGGIQGAISYILGQLGEFWNSFLNGETIVNRVINNIGMAIGGVGIVIKSALEEAIKFITGGDFSFDNIFSGLEGSLDGVASSGVFGQILGIFQSFAGGISSFITNLRNSEFDLSGIIANIRGSFSGLFDLLQNFFSNIDVNQLASLVVLGSVVALILKVRQMFTAVTSLVTALKGSVGVLTNALKSFSGQDTIIDRLTSLANSTKWLQIALAITAIGIAMKALQDLGLEKASESILMLGIIATGLYVVMKKFQELSNTMAESSKSTNFNTMSLQMLEMGAALALIASAIKTVSDALGENGSNLESVKGAVIALGQFFALMTSAAYILGKQDTKSMQNMGVTILEMSAAIMVMSIGVSQLAKFDVENVKAATLAMDSLFVALGLLIVVLSKIDGANIASATAGLAGISTVVLSLSAAIAILSMLDPAAIGTGVVALTALMALFTIFTAVLAVIGGMEGAGNLAGVSSMMISFSASLTILAAALLLLHTVPIEYVAGVIVIFSAAIAGLALVATATKDGLNALSMFLLSIGGSVLLFGAGLLAAATAALKFIEAGVALTGFILGLAAVATAFGDDFVDVIETGLDALFVIIEGFLDRLPSLTFKIAAVISSFIAAVALAIGNSKARIAFAIFSLAAELLPVIADLAGPLLKAIVQLLDTIAANVRPILQAIGRILDAILAGAGDLIIYFIAGILHFVGSILDGLLPGFLSGIADKVNDVADGMIANIEDTTIDRSQEALEKIVKAVEEGGKEIMNDAGEVIGVEYVDGYVEALEGRQEEVRQAGYDIADSAVVGAREAQDSHSPSMVMYHEGENYVDGYANGIEENSGKAVTASENMVEDSIDAAKTKMESGTDELNASAEELVNTVGQNSADLASYWGEYSGAQFVTSFSNTIYGNSYLMKQMQRSAQNYSDSMSEAQKASRKGMSRKEAQLLGIDWEDVSDDLNETGYDIGMEMGDFFGEGLAASGGGAAGAKTQAEKIKEAFQEAFDARSLNNQVDDLLYELWEMQNPNATEAEKNAKKIATYSNKLERATLDVQTYQKIYAQTVEAYGSNSQEALQAFLDMGEAEKSFIKLQQEIQELQSGQVSSTTENAKAFVEMSRMLTQNMADEGEEVVTMYERMKAHGFTDEQIRNEFAREAGWQQPMTELADKLSTEGQNAATAAANGVAGAFVQGIFYNAEYMTTGGEACVQAIADGMTSSTGLLSNAATQIVDAGKTSFDNQKPKWLDVGKNIDEGLKEGVHDNEDLPIDQIAETSNNVIDESKDAFGVQSPSTQFIYIGEMLMKGLEVGIENGASSVVNSIVAVVNRIVRAAKAALGINSPSTEGIYIGEMFDLGIFEGTKNYAYLVAAGAERVVEDAAEAAEDSTKNYASMVQDYVNDVMDGDNTVSVILDVDTTMLDQAISDYEQYKKDVNDANAAYNAREKAIRDNPAYRSPWGGLTEAGALALERLQAQYRNSSMQDITPAIDFQIAKSLAAIELYNKELLDKYDTEGMTVNFTQNNTSPDPLTREQIYRDTKQQLASFKKSMTKNSKIALGRR